MWSSSDTSVAAIDSGAVIESGLVTGLSAGTAKITASWEGAASEPFDLTVAAMGAVGVDCRHNQCHSPQDADDSLELVAVAAGTGGPVQTLVGLPDLLH